MKLGVNLMLWTGGYTRKSIKLIDKVGKMGWDGVELPIFNAKDVDINATRRALDAHGLGATTCTVIVTGTFLSSSARERTKAVDHVRSVLDVSKAIGADCVCGPMYSPVGLLIGRGPNATEWKNAVKSMKEVAKTAEILDIQVAVEPLNRFETFFLNTCADATKFAKEVGSSHVGVHYDTFHQNIEETDPVGAIKKIGRKWLKHVHTCENDRGVPGTGHVPWDATMKALKAVKYDGWYVLESFVPAIKELAKAACIWRPLAKDGDDLARRGLKFLRKYA